MLLERAKAKREGESFALKKSKLPGLSPRFLVLVLLHLHHSPCRPQRTTVAELASQPTKREGITHESDAAAARTRSRAAASPPVFPAAVQRHGGRRREPPYSRAGGRRPIELRRPLLPRRGRRRVRGARRRRAVVPRRRRRPATGNADRSTTDTHRAPADTQGGEVAVAEGRQEAGRRRRQRHRRWRWRAAAAVRARGGRRPRGRARQRAAGRAHAAGQHAGEKVPAVRQPAGAVVGSPAGGVPLRHAVQRGDADPALLHAVHEQGGLQRQRWRRRQRRSVKLRPPTAKGGFVF